MFTKTTTNLGLPLWQPHDHPDFLTDLNQENKILDEEIGKNNQDFAHLQETVDAISTNMTTIQEEFKVLQEKVDDLQNIEDNPTVKKLVSDMTQAQSDITALEDAVKTNTTNISLLTSRCSALESDVNTLKTTVTGHNRDIANIQDAIGTLSDSVQNMSTSITALETRMTAVELTANKNKTDIEGINSSITTITGDITNIKDKDSTQDGEIEAIKTRVSNIETGESGTSADISKLQSDVSKLQTDVTTLTTTTETLTTNVDTNTSEIDNLKTAQSSTAGDLATLATRVSSNETSIINLQTETSQLDTRVENIEDSLTMVLSDSIPMANVDITFNNIVHQVFFKIVNKLLIVHVTNNTAETGVITLQMTKDLYNSMSKNDAFTALEKDGDINIMAKTVFFALTGTNGTATTTATMLSNTGKLSDFLMNIYEARGDIHILIGGAIGGIVTSDPAPINMEGYL